MERPAVLKCRWCAWMPAPGEDVDYGYRRLRDHVDQQHQPEGRALRKAIAEWSGAFDEWAPWRVYNQARQQGGEGDHGAAQA